MERAHYISPSPHMPDCVTAKCPRDWGDGGRQRKGRGRWGKRSKLEKIKWEEGREEGFERERERERERDMRRGGGGGGGEVYKKGKRRWCRGRMKWASVIPVNAHRLASTTAKKTAAEKGFWYAARQMHLSDAAWEKMLTWRQNVEI